MRNLYCFLAALMLTLTLSNYSYSKGVFNFSNTANSSVKDISNSQIAKLVKQMDEQGLSVTEAMEIAKAKGASDTQINELKKRIEDYLQQQNSATSKQETSTETPTSSIPDSGSFSQRIFTETPENTLNIFGFNFFNTKNLNFASNINTPLSEDYLIGIGDNIQISVYGASQQEYTLQVQKDRAINIPGIGPVYIGSLSLSNAKKLVKNRLSSIYNGMRSSHPDTFVSITVGNVSGININVIGEACYPGTFTLPATATVFNALYLAGGPGENGSFRSIDIIREGKIIATTDVYGYLIEGDTRSNIQLRNNDVIRINPYLERVTLKGAFKRNGIFEAKPGETIANVIRYAGGFTSKSYTKQISLVRNNSRTLTFKTILTADFDNFTVLSGDEISAEEVIERFENRVTIQGAVFRPGDYELTENLSLRQLIQKAEGTKEEAFLERGILTRKGNDMQLQTLSFSVKDVLNGYDDILLKREDSIFITSVFDMHEERTVKIIGAVQNPGTFSYAEGMTVADLIFTAGGFKEKASISNIEVARRLSYDEAEKFSDNLIHTYLLSVDRNLNLAPKDSQMHLMPFDYVYVRTIPGLKKGQNNVSIKGEIKYAGNYGIATNKERLSDLIHRAGGVTPNSYIQGASLRRKYILSNAEYESKLQITQRNSAININEENVKKEIYKVVTIDLEDALKNPGGTKDLLLEDGDQLFIPKVLQTIKVSGAVLNPVAITFNKNFSVRDYIHLSGGFSHKAKKNKVYVLHPNGEAHATKGFLFKKYPKIVPGSEIIVPEKPEIDKVAQTQKWISMGSGVAGIAASIAAIISITK